MNHGSAVMDRDALLQRAVDLWGVDAQMRMLQEECAELIAAVNRFSRERCGAEDVAEEVADVLIMAEQARRIVGAADVDAAMERKLNRLARRLSEGEERRAQGITEAFDRGERL
jgi:NTP pyrophosphatase (non-canonical NTP hydrolase)